MERKEALNTVCQAIHNAMVNDGYSDTLFDALVDSDETGNWIYCVGRDCKINIDYDKVLDALIRKDTSGKFIYWSGLYWPQEQFDYEKAFRALKGIESDELIALAKDKWPTKVEENSVLTSIRYTIGDEDYYIEFCSYDDTMLKRVLNSLKECLIDSGFSRSSVDLMIETDEMNEINVPNNRGAEEYGSMKFIDWFFPATQGESNED